VLYGVCETSSQAREHVNEKYSGTRLYTCLDDVLADDRVEGVAISTPAETHYDLALQALQAGKDVFVEKPLALTYSRGLRLTQTAEQLGRILMVGHLLEYHPAVQKLSELISAGVLGHIQYIYSNRLNLGRFRREENILWSFAPHDISVILRLVDEDPIEVMAAGGAYLQPNVADITVTNLLFDNGVRAHIFVSWLHPYKEQRLVVVGSEKMAVFNDLAAGEQKLLLYDQGADWVDNRPVPRKGAGTPVIFDAVEPLREELAHFIHCITKRVQPRTDVYNGMRVLKVLHAAQRSLQMGGTRVPLVHDPTRDRA
jgi:UDP-2-acetamido-3-amino-2,3-dideoxy-glucuronate N-acetyltransferase